MRILKSLSILTLILLSISNVDGVSASYQSGAGTKVTANIPSKVDIRIYGYTSPYSIVQATSIRVFAQVSSDETGYFLIDPLPISTQAKEICLTTVDSQQRYGFPLCVNLPTRDKPTEIGPLLLSPTISLSSGNLVQLQSSQAQATGESLPNSTVEIYFFDNDNGSKKNLTDILFPKAYARSIPRLTTKTDRNGSFSINLPSNKPLAFRLFAKAFYELPKQVGKLPTPKSQTLTFTVSSYTNYWVRNFLPRLIFLFMFIAMLAYLVWYDIKTKRIRLLFAEFSETRLKPFGVRARLKLRRIWYNFRASLPSNRI